MTAKGLCRTLLLVLVWLLALALVFLTVLPLWDTNLWWVRALGFPRLQIAVAAIAVFVPALFI